MVAARTGRASAPGPSAPEQPVCAWRQRGVVRGVWIGLPLTLSLWYALASTALALTGGL